MCLLFVYVNPDPAPNEYRLVLVNVRDEIYHRPTERASFWKGDPNIIGGRDLEPGKEGGTWLAMNKNGKVSALLNILQPDKDILPNKKGRGFLVVDFVKGNQDGFSYLKKVCDHGDEYNGFLLVTLDIRNQMNGVDIAYFTNATDESPKRAESGEVAFHAFGNSPPNKPWLKASTGVKKFENIVKSYSTTETKEHLLESIFSLLMSDEKFPVDTQMKMQGAGKPVDFLQKLSAIFVYIPEYYYGSRCHTAVLVDSSGKVDYVERSLVDFRRAKEPEQWNEIHKTFNLVDI